MSNPRRRDFVFFSDESHENIGQIWKEMGIIDRNCHKILGSGF